MPGHDQLARSLPRTFDTPLPIDAVLAEPARPRAGHTAAVLGARERACEFVEHGVDRKRGVKAAGQGSHQLVMPGLVPCILVLLEQAENKTWMAVTSTAMTEVSIVHKAKERFSFAAQTPAPRSHR